MPYIEKDDRTYFNVKDRFAYVQFDKPGELNYVITELCLEYIRQKKISYTTYNEVIGILECAKLEMYRRAVSKYEDKKIEENGDVY